MTRHRKPRHGEGTAWLVSARSDSDYLCYWYTGTNDGRLAEQARVAGTSEALAWGRLRTPSVRIRTAEGESTMAASGA
jgi:hypothetical protein